MGAVGVLFIYLIIFFGGGGEGKEAEMCAIMCMYVNKKGLYCVVNVVSV